MSETSEQILKARHKMELEVVRSALSRIHAKVDHLCLKNASLHILVGHLLDVIKEHELLEDVLPYLED